MRTSDKGIELIKSFEGCELKAYLDAVNIPTIGFGHIANVRIGDTITQEKAEQYLRDDLQNAEDCIADYVSVPLNENQHAALASFIFNCGRTAFKDSTLLRKLNTGDYAGAAAEFGKWVKAGNQTLNGLVRRRKAEHDLFMEEV